MTTLENKTVLVTGASRGIGRATALASNGFDSLMSSPSESAMRLTAVERYFRSTLASTG
jgi:NAD(P)-dependent dehydrogenase (short-subunit alcohol dehydrogenase family)